MRFKLLLILSLTFASLVSIGYSWTLTGNQPFDYDNIETKIVGTNLEIQQYLGSNSGSTQYLINNCGGNLPILCYVLGYTRNSEDFVLHKYFYYGISSSNSFSFNKYRYPNDLKSSSCTISFTNPSISSVNIQSNLHPFNDYFYGANNVYTNLIKIPNFNSKLDKYYNMKTFAFAIATGQITSSQFFYKPNEALNYYTYNTRNQMSGVYLNAFNNLNFNSKVPYVLAKPTSVSLTYPNIQADLQAKCDSGVNNACGTFDIKYYTIPIDGKCDFNSNGILESSEFQSVISTVTTTISTFKDSDKDGVPDNSDLCPSSTGTVNSKGCSQIQVDSDTDGVCNLGVGAKSTGQFCSDSDLCSSTFGTSNYQGCPYKYSKIGGDCDNYYITFVPAASTLTSSYSGDAPWYKLWESDSNYFFKVNSNQCTLGKTTSSAECSRSAGAPNSNLIGTGNYSFFNQDPGVDKALGTCNLRLNTLVQCDYKDNFGNTIGTISQGDSIKYYKYKSLLPSESRSEFLGSFSQIVTCNVNGALIQHPIGFAYLNPEFLGEEYKNVIRNSDGTFSLKDKINQGKISCPTTDLNCKINISGTSTPIDLNNLNSTNNQNIKIYKQGILNRTEAVDSKVIALKAHTIKKFKTGTQAKNYIEKSVQLMEKFDIVKDLNYIAGTNTTNVKISTANFANGGQIQNLTIYQVVDKNIAPNYDSINFISDGGAQRFVVDKDPIIGWYFNDTNGNTSIEYNVSGNNEGGTIIISQEPILFNEGELIINYREGKVGCSAGEIHLLDLENLDNSRILDKNTGLYQVCITHLDSGITLTNGPGINTINISSYELNGNISANFNQLTNKLQLSTNRNDIFWDLRIQESNPDGNFSCLGSYDITPPTSNLQSHTSLFGDCGFNPKNRIWMHLGADYIPPTTNTDIPYLGHSIKVELNAEDNIGGSGLNKTYYCAIEDTNPCQNLKTDFTIYTGNSFTLTCAQDWSCTRTLKFYSTDLAGNIETMNTDDLFLIDKGSACQSDCTAKPAPNRYLKECRNLNGCFYAQTPGELDANIGKAVANNCNLLTEGSYVNFNSTHEIKCPNGPYKLKTFTDTSVGITGPSCTDIVKLPYPAIYNGESITLNIITCFDK